eukprot:gene20043-biopygen13069
MTPYFKSDFEDAWPVFFRFLAARTQGCSRHDDSLLPPAAAMLCSGSVPRSAAAAAWAGSPPPPISAFWPGLGELQAYSRPAVFRAMRILHLRRGRWPSVPAPNTKLHPRPLLRCCADTATMNFGVG